MNNSDEITKLLKDPILVRIVNVTGIASLSILELLEYNFTRKDVNHALSNGVIAIDKSGPSSTLDYPQISDDKARHNILVSGDYYFYNFLDNKVKLTDLGLSILESAKDMNE